MTREETQFGGLRGLDPAEAGRRGGLAKAGSVSIVAALRRRIEERGVAEALADALIDRALEGERDAVAACKVALDRIDGPVAVQLDVRTDTSRLVSLGESLQEVPALPVEVQEMEGEHGASERGEAAEDT